MNPEWAALPPTETLAWCEIDPQAIPTKSRRLEISSKANPQRCKHILGEVLENVDAIFNHSRPSLSVLLMNNYIQYLCENGFSSKLTEPISKKLHNAAIATIEPHMNSSIMARPDLAVARLIDCYNSWSDTLKRLSMRCMHLNHFYLKFSKKYDDIEGLGNTAFMESTLASSSLEAFSLFNPADPPIRQKVFVNAVDICSIYLANPGSEDSIKAFETFERFFDLVDKLDPMSKVIGQPHLLIEILEKGAKHEVCVELPSRLQRMEIDIKNMLLKMSYSSDDIETQILSPLSDRLINKRFDEISKVLVPQLFALRETHIESFQYFYRRADDLHKESILNNLRNLMNEEASQLIKLTTSDKYKKLFAAHESFNTFIRSLEESETIDFKPHFAPVLYKESAAFARFVDSEVKKFYQKGTIDTSFESVVNFILPHFTNYVQFWQSYINYLSKRFIVKMSQTGEVPSSQIDIEKQVFNIFKVLEEDVTEKVTRMITDVELSGSLNDQTSPFCGLVVNGNWPKMPSNEPFRLHPDLCTSLKNFENAYLEKNEHRGLEWSYFSSLVTLNFNGMDSRIEVSCNAYIATVLLLFNSQREYRFDQLRSDSGLPDASLEDILSLCCSKNLLIKRADFFAINQSLRGEKIHLALPKKGETSTRKEVFAKPEGPLDLRPMIRARIVRLLKQKRTCSHTTVMRDLKGLLKQDFHSPDIKTIIESLIEQQYIARKDLHENYNQYVYLP